MNISKKARRIWILIMIPVTIIGVLITTYHSWRWVIDRIQLGPVEEMPGYIGRLTIDSVGINVACVEVQPGQIDTTEKLKSAVDRADCAAKIWISNKLVNPTPEDGVWIIADHNYDSFKTLNKCQIGDIAVITLEDGTTEKYVVTANFTGHNVKNDLTDNNYNSVIDANNGGIILYTCIDTWENVHIVFLHPLVE